MQLLLQERPHRKHDWIRVCAIFDGVSLCVGAAEGILGRRMEQCSSLDAWSAFFASFPLFLFSSFSPVPWEKDGGTMETSVLEQLFDAVAHADRGTSVADGLQGPRFYPAHGDRLQCEPRSMSCSTAVLDASKHRHPISEGDGMDGADDPCVWIEPRGLLNTDAFLPFHTIMAISGWVSTPRGCDWQPLACMAYSSFQLEGFECIYLASVAPWEPWILLTTPSHDMQRRRKHPVARAEEEDQAGSHASARCGVSGPLHLSAANSSLEPLYRSILPIWLVPLTGNLAVPLRSHRTRERLD